MESLLLPELQVAKSRHSSQNNKYHMMNITGFYDTMVLALGSHQSRTAEYVVYNTVRR